MPSASPPQRAASTGRRAATSRGSGCPALAQTTVAVAGRSARYAIVMNLPTAISPTTTSFACARKSRRLGVLACERAEHELRHRHVGGRVDAVAGDVAEHDRQPAVGELEEVEDVAADVDLRRRLVDRRRPRGPARRAARAAAATAASSRRTASAAGRAARCRSRARPAARSSARSRACRASIGSAGSSERIVSSASSSPAVAIGSSAAVDPFSRNGSSSACAPPRRVARRDVEQQRLLRSATDRGCGRSRIVRTASCEARVGDVHGARR